MDHGTPRTGTSPAALASHQRPGIFCSVQRTASSLLLLCLTLSMASAGEEPLQRPAVVHIEAGKAALLLSSEDRKERPTIIDIRTPGEFREGHIKGAKLIDFLGEDFSGKIARLERDKPYLVHCRSGGRSTQSLDTWKKLGFKRIYHLDGGMLAWQKAGLPVSK